MTKPSMSLVVGYLSRKERRELLQGLNARIAKAKAEIATWSPEKLASMQLQGPTEDSQAPSAAKKEGQP